MRGPKASLYSLSLALPMAVTMGGMLPQKIWLGWWPMFNPKKNFAYRALVIVHLELFGGWHVFNPPKNLDTST